MPNIIGSVNIAKTDATEALSPSIANGVFTKTSNGRTYAGGSSGVNAVQINFNASNSNNIYGASATVQPPSISLIPQIKF